VAGKHVHPEILRELRVRRLLVALATSAIPGLVLVMATARATALTGGTIRPPPPQPGASVTADTPANGRQLAGLSCEQGQWWFQGSRSQRDSTLVLADSGA